MTLSELITRPCTITHRSSGQQTDSYGNEIPTETTTTTVCELQQRRRDEPTGEGEVSSTDWVAFFLPGEALTTADRLTVDGETYELVGDPWTARNPRTGDVSHIEASVRKVGS